MRTVTVLFFLLFSLIAEAQKINIPLGGNSFITAGGQAGAKLDGNGWHYWKDTATIWSTYVWINKPGTIKANWFIDLPEGNRSRINCSFNCDSCIMQFHCEGGRHVYSTGYQNISAPGYLRIDMKGVSKTGNEFGEVRSLELEGTAIDSSLAYVKNNEGNYFYWGRRGPSVHINYDLRDIKEDLEWFYSEITIPKGNDVIGSYFMANGFAEGYFGMQVNSSSERRMLFSVWSPFATDDPAKIPANKKIRLIKKGEKVHTGEFGNEGSGGQSYIVYPWKAGFTYSFLIRAQPLADSQTRYSAWFKEKGKADWQLMAIFERPATSTYLKRIHSFLENFVPETGFITRKAWYHDQWVLTSKGNWIPITKMQFSADVTARKGYRMDYKGGVGENGFFLQNDGFFSDRTMIGSLFEIRSDGKAPDIDTIRVMER